MAINVTKPAINLREKLNEVTLETGIKGEELLNSDTSTEARNVLELDTHLFTDFESTGIDDNATSNVVTIESDGDILLKNGANYSWIRPWSSTTGDMIIGADSSATGSGGSSMIFRTRGSEKLRIQNGGGISFNGDTAAANALDDYEEGTFTATLATGATTTPTATGKYTKIGDTAFVAFNGGFGSITMNGAALTISGLPFTPVGRTSGSFGNQARVQYVADAHHYCQVEASTTVVDYFSMIANAGGPVTLKTEASGTYTPAFNFQLVYKV